MNENSVSIGADAMDDATLADLHALIDLHGGKRTWPEEAGKIAEGLLAATLCSPTSTQTQLGQALSLAQDLPTTTITAVFEKHWLDMPSNRKDQLVSEMLRLNSEKSQARQVAIAEKIAHSDAQGAAKILHGLISRDRKGRNEDFWPQLSKEQRRWLRSRFGNGNWVFFDVPQEPVMRVLLAGFVEAMTEPNLDKGIKSQRLIYDFAKWALSTVKRVNVSDHERADLRSRVTALAKGLVQDWRSELVALAGEEAPVEVHPLSTASTEKVERPPNHEGGTRAIVNEIRKEVERVPSQGFEDPTVSVELMSKANLSGSALLRSDVVALIMRKQDEVEALNASIHLLQNDVRSVRSEVELIERVFDLFERSERAQIDLEAQLREARLNADGLRSSTSQLESELNSSRAAHRTLEERSRLSVRDEQELRRALDEEKMSRETERRELEREIERTAKRRLDDFRAQLARALRTILENKRTTDDQEPSDRLSEFLRARWNEVESQLSQLGVHISKDG
jgi:hypothetical protein